MQPRTIALQAATLAPSPRPPQWVRGAWLHPNVRPSFRLSDLARRPRSTNLVVRFVSPQLISYSQLCGFATWRLCDKNILRDEYFAQSRKVIDAKSETQSQSVRKFCSSF